MQGRGAGPFKHSNFQKSTSYTVHGMWIPCPYPHFLHQDVYSPQNKFYPMCDKYPNIVQWPNISHTHTHTHTRTHARPIEHAHGILILLRRFKRACANMQTHQSFHFWHTQYYLSHYKKFLYCGECSGALVLQGICCSHKLHQNCFLREHESLTLIAL